MNISNHQTSFSALSNYKIIPKNSSLFPENLKVLPDCPELLFVLGNNKILNNFSISIVGTRNSSEEGNTIAFQLSQNLSRENIIIISGLANGIDTAAHLGSISVGKTIAIVASGFDYISTQKKELINQILLSGGTIISEYFPDTPPQKFSFLKRNRLIATLSQATVIIQSPEKGGSINTANTAKKFNKPLFVIPWNINNFRGIGSNKLLQEGAYFLTNYTQILNFFSIPHSTTFSKMSVKTHTPKSNLLKANLNSSSIPNKFLPIYNFIAKNTPISKEKIYTSFSQESIADLNSKLIIMELNNWIICKNEEYFILNSI